MAWEPGLPGAGGLGVAPGCCVSLARARVLPRVSEPRGPIARSEPALVPPPSHSRAPRRGPPEPPGERPGGHPPPRPGSVHLCARPGPSPPGSTFIFALDAPFRVQPGPAPPTGPPARPHPGPALLGPRWRRRDGGPDAPAPALPGAGGPPQPGQARPRPVPQAGLSLRGHLRRLGAAGVRGVGAAGRDAHRHLRPGRPRQGARPALGGGGAGARVLAPGGGLAGRQGGLVPPQRGDPQTQDQPDAGPAHAAVGPGLRGGAGGGCAQLVPVRLRRAGLRGVRPGQPALAGGCGLGRGHGTPLGRPARVRGAAAALPEGHLRGVAGPVPAQPAHLGPRLRRPPAAGLVPPHPRAGGLADALVPGLGVPLAGCRGDLAAGGRGAAGGRAGPGAAQRRRDLPAPQPPAAARGPGQRGAVPGPARGPGGAAGDGMGPQEAALGRRLPRDRGRGDSGGAGRPGRGAAAVDDSSTLVAGRGRTGPPCRGRGARRQLIPWVRPDHPPGGRSHPGAGHRTWETSPGQREPGPTDCQLISAPQLCCAL